LITLVVNNLDNSEYQMVGWADQVFSLVMMTNWDVTVSWVQQTDEGVNIYICCQSQQNKV